MRLDCMRHEQHLRIVVAALTRRRPVFLSTLLHSWKVLNLPKSCEVIFLIVENDDKERSREVVNEVVTASFCPEYLLETEAGIPFARNRAARFAIENSCDLLVFIDDDEVADPDWLKNLVEGYRQSSAVLLGAPLRAKKPEQPLSAWQNLIFTGVEQRYRKKEARAMRRASLEDTDGVTIVTNNWIAEVALFADQNIWFDEKMRFTGGTDTKFYHEVRARGLPTGWVNDAFVYEVFSTDRLSFIYQMKRARDQSSANFRRKIEQDGRAILRGIVPIFLRSVTLIPLAISVPFTLGKTLVPLARSSGWFLGRIMTVFGYRSKLYENPTGE